jgi:type II secretory pathway component PulF
LVYIIVVFALSILLKENLIYLLFILLSNACLVLFIGRGIIRTLVFPYSFWVIQDGVNLSMSRRYTSDFAILLEKSVPILVSAQLQKQE